MKVATARKLIPQTAIDKLRERCLASISEVMLSVPDATITDTIDGKLLFADRGAKILAVAHLDTVQDLRHFDVIQTDTQTRVNNCQLDDRLGAYIILDMLPALGLEYDILLTEGEESGRSTAAHFVGGKEYNWIFSFDRMGCDAVYYQYGNADWIAKMEDAGFNANRGSFSDIVDLEHLGVKALNVGCGYYDNHGVHSYCILEQTAKMVSKFKKFYELYAGERQPHTPQPYKQYSGYYGTNDYAFWRGDYDRWMAEDDWNDGWRKNLSTASAFTDDSARYLQSYLPHKTGAVACVGCGVADDGREHKVYPDGYCIECFYELRMYLENCELCGDVPADDGSDDEIFLEHGVCLDCFERYGKP